MLAVGNSRMLRDLCLALKGSPLEGVPGGFGGVFRV